MAYVSLNRRWRPRSFVEVTRQEHVTRTLQNAIKQGRLAQAYLFGGQRGTGKTTMARILAMGLNCQAPGQEGPTAEPCGECASCKTIQSGTSPDVIELDAASNRGIDEIRALQENVRLSPMSGRYKVYIIDEAHQMTKDAYNAFLKTLEEPPPHVVFVLATTEPEKIIPTVRSRCQRFDFRPVPETDIAGRLRAVAKAEGFKLSDDLLGLIARKAEGSLRDALGLLEQCVAFAGESPTVTDFLNVTGGLEVDALRKLAFLAAEGRAIEVVVALDSMLRAGRDPGAVLDGLVVYLREVFLAGLRLREAGAGVADGAGPPADPELVADARAWSSPKLLSFVGALVKAAPEMRYSPQPRLVLEMALLALALGRQAASPAVGPSSPVAAAPVPPPSKPANPAPAADPSPPARPTAAPNQASPGGGVAGSGARGGVAPPRDGGQAAHPTPISPATPQPRSGLSRPDPDGVDLQWFRDNWDELLNRIRKRSVFARAFLLKAAPASFGDGVLTLAFDTQFHKERTEEDKNRLACEEALSEAAGIQLRLKCRLASNGNGNGARPEPAPEAEPPPEERPVPRAQPVKLPPPARPRAARPSPAPTRIGAQRPAAETAAPDAIPAALPRAVAPAGPNPGTVAPAGPNAGAGKAPGSETVRSALSIFGGRLVDDSPEGKQ